MGNISFVILNYNAYEEAIACAESILHTQSYPDVAIVIVDNGSANDSGERLAEYARDKKRVHLLVSKKNLGFARGNNLGIRYAREQFSPEFVVVANSDMIFEQPDYCEKLVDIYRKNRYDILGGDIIDASRTQHFNPVARERNYTKNYMRKQVLISWMKAAAFRLIKFFHLKRAVAGHYGIVIRDKEENVKEGSRPLTTREVEGKAEAADCRIEERMEGVLLHGCCLVFSRDFFRQLDGFWEGTFLYAEEEILYYLAMQKGMTLLYTPEVVCMHKEARTTNALYQDFCDRKIFYFSHITKSYRRFLTLMKKDGGNAV